MRDIKIGKLLLLGFSIPVIAIIGLMLLSLSQMDTINQQSTEISSNWLPSVQLIERINTQTADLRNDEAVHIISTDAQTIQQVTNTINQKKQQIEKTINDYRVLISSPEEQALVDEFDGLYRQYLAVQVDLLRLSENNNNDEAKALFLGNSLAAYSRYSATLVELSDLNERSALAASEYGDIIYDRSMNIMIIAVIVVTIIIILMALRISTLLVSSISIIQHAMIKMSQGDLSVHIDNQGENELGVLSDCLNKTAEQFAKLTQQLISVADTVDNSSQTLASTMEQADSNSQNMLMQVEQVATAVNEMSSTAMDISRNATEAESSAIEANQSVDKGHHALQESNKISDKINHSIKESTEIVNQLKSYSNEIGAVIEVINGISEQTNLLALNAAIEAARAGEQGRGFAVVADEVRTLAGKTQTSTINIQEIITKLQNQASKADEYMQSNAYLIDEAQKIAQEVRDSFSDIALSVSRISEMNSLVATASTEQSSVTDDISKNITQMVDMVNQNVAGISHSSKASIDLSKQSSNQKKVLSFFTIN
ncbi:methyl-accepting chemotaxis protein [Shewanella ulleungensis]|uniref:methyl-accepting chemotaxis protein n=1 Tax=Shewanella ulleungensis TaxID=2282699 RepID=UPI003D7A62E7